MNAPRPNFVLAQINLLRTTHPDIWDDEELRELALASETGLHDFITNLTERMETASANADAISILIQKFTARRDRFVRRYDALRELVRKLLEHANLRRLELAIATFSIRAGPRKVIITDEAALPDNVIRIKREPNKTLIKELIDQGVPIAGATLSNAEETLAVRIK